MSEPATREGKAKLRVTLGKIEAANVVARIVRPMSFYVNEDWILSSQAIAKVKYIIEKEAVGKTKEEILFVVNEIAGIILDLNACRADNSDLSEYSKKVESLAKSTRQVICAWGAIDHNLSINIGHVITGTLKIGGGGDVSPGIILEHRAAFDRIKGVLEDDLWRMVSASRLILAAFKSSKTRGDLFAHWGVWRVANSWRLFTGRLPTVTRNRDAVSGPQTTPFQRLLAEMLPQQIGDAVVRDVVDAMKFASENTDKEALGR